MRVVNAADLCCSSCRRLEPRHAFRDRVHLLPRVGEREVPAPRPQLEQVAVVRVVGVAGLPRRVEADRVIPVLGVGDDLERAAGRLVVAVAGGADGRAVAAARQRTDVELRARRGVDRVRQRMRDQRVVIASPGRTSSACMSAPKRLVSSATASSMLEATQRVARRRRVARRSGRRARAASRSPLGRDEVPPPALRSAAGHAAARACWRAGAAATSRRCRRRPSPCRARSPTPSAGRARARWRATGSDRSRSSGTSARAGSDRSSFCSAGHLGDAEQAARSEHLGDARRADTDRPTCSAADPCTG